MLTNSESTNAAVSAPPAPMPRPLRAGLILLGLLLVAANLRAAITTVGPVLHNIEADQHLSSAAASVLVLLGVAIAILNVLLPSIIKRDFPTRIGPITGAYTAVQFGVAALTAGVAVPLAGHASSGWRLSLGIWAGLALIAANVFAPQLRTRPGDPSPGPPHPDGLAPHGPVLTDSRVDQRGAMATQ